MLSFLSSPDTRLWSAISAGKPAAVVSALNAGANPNTPREGRPPLIQAVRALGQRPEAFAIVDALLAAGADIDGRDEYGCTALSYTVVRAHHSWFQGVSDPSPSAQSGGLFFSSAIRLGLNTAPVELGGRRHDTTPDEWTSQSAGEMMVRLLDAGATLQVPLGYAGVLEKEKLKPWGRSSERTLSLHVFQTLLFMACETPARVEGMWERVARTAGSMETADLNVPDRDRLTPLVLAIARGEEDAAVALLHRGVDTLVPWGACAKLGLPQTPQVRELRGGEPVFARFEAECAAQDLDDALPAASSPRRRRRM